MNPMQEFVVYGFAWCMWIGGILGIMLYAIDEQTYWRRNVKREFDR